MALLDRSPGHRDRRASAYLRFAWHRELPSQRLCLVPVPTGLRSRPLVIGSFGHVSDHHHGLSGAVDLWPVCALFPFWARCRDDRSSSQKARPAYTSRPSEWIDQPAVLVLRQTACLPPFGLRDLHTFSRRMALSFNLEPAT